LPGLASYSQSSCLYLPSRRDYSHVLQHPPLHCYFIFKYVLHLNIMNLSWFIGLNILVSVNKIWTQNKIWNMFFLKTEKLSETNSLFSKPKRKYMTFNNIKVSFYLLSKY
jgi:hypothetical protein